MFNKFSVNIFIVIFSITLSLFLQSCNKTTSEDFPIDPVPLELTTDQVFLIESENTFAFDIFKNILQSSGESENIIISPLSISYALSMTLNGANGTTLDAITEALRVKGIPNEKINISYNNLTEALLNLDKRVNISIANSVWTENNFVVKAPFIDILTNYYNSESKSFDINDPLSPDQINLWIESKTDGLIKNMVEKLNENTVMLLINAIFFKGKWKSQFESDKTVTGPFVKPDGVIAEVPMMKQKSDFKIFNGEGFVLAEFPYGQSNFVMDLILPDENVDMDNIIQILNSDSLREWIGKMIFTETDLSFPRFKYGYKKQLKESLTNMGMGIAFTENADLSNISDLGILINDVTHQAFIETNEEGTRAAAATIVDIGLTSMPADPFVLNIDHSFLYLIRETSTNTIIFLGRVADPLLN